MTTTTTIKKKSILGSGVCVCALRSIYISIYIISCIVHCYFVCGMHIFRLLFCSFVRRKSENLYAPLCEWVRASTRVLNHTSTAHYGACDSLLLWYVWARIFRESFERIHVHTSLHYPCFSFTCLDTLLAPSYNQPKQNKSKQNHIVCMIYVECWRVRARGRRCVFPFRFYCFIGARDFKKEKRKEKKIGALFGLFPLFLLIFLLARLIFLLFCFSIRRVCYF